MSGIRRIFYDNLTGERIIEVGRDEGMIIPTIERDIEIDERLANRSRDTFDVLELPFGAYQQDFAESNGYRVNVETKTLEFSYPDPNAPDEPPVFVEPLTEQVKKLEAQTKQLNDDFLSLSDYVTTL
jgi:hypothetical protein